MVATVVSRSLHVPSLGDSEHSAPVSQNVSLVLPDCQSLSREARYPKF